MNIHEFQGKSLLRAYDVDIQEGFVAETPDQAVMVAGQLREGNFFYAAFVDKVDAVCVGFDNDVTGR